AGGGGGKREDEDAEEVEAVADGEEAAADGEGEGADEVEEGDEGQAHRISRPCGHPGWKPSGFQGFLPRGGNRFDLFRRGLRGPAAAGRPFRSVSPGLRLRLRPPPLLTAKGHRPP